MTPAYFNRVVRRELNDMLRQGLLDAATYEQLRSRYVLTRWDWRSLGRWFLIFGAISSAAGVILLARQLFGFSLERLAVLLAVLMIGLFIGAYPLKQRHMVWTASALELLGAFGLIGLSFTLGLMYSTGSGNWPALLLIDLIILLPLTYALHNVLLLILSAVVFFVWFGGETGYVSGWGAYWFGMSYPLRFLFVSLLMIAAALVHWHSEQGPLAKYRGFFKVWLSAGLFFGEMALWEMSLFGNIGEIWNDFRLASVAELVMFNVLWGGVNGALIYFGAKYALRMMRGYDATFLIIQGYTLFFWHIAGHLDPILSLAIAGGSTLWLVVHLEKKRRAEKS